MLGTGLIAGPAFAASVSETAETNVPQQQEGTLNGVVRDANGKGLVGVGVVVLGTTQGTITDADGAYRLPNIPVGSTIRFSSIGYKDVEAVFAGSPIHVTMDEDTQLLNEVVVTALGITREKKSLGYAVQDVKADAIERSGSATLTDALQGKVAGLMINNSATGAGGSSRVVIRGSSSLSDNNEPLYIVDGVPYDTGGHDIDGQSGLWGGIDRAGGAFDINPEDIASVSVLKGPTAAALYGSRAGNGVILITTKKGGKNGRVGVTYNGKFSWSPVSYYPDLQNTYGQGNGGNYFDPDTGTPLNSNQSWGARLGSISVPAWFDSSRTIPYQGDENPYTAYYRTGNTQSNNVTLAGGGAENPFRLTFGHDDTQSVIRPTRIDKTSVDLVSKFTLVPWLTLDVKANYVNTIGHNRQTRGLYGATYYINTLPRNIRMADLDAYTFNPVDLAEGSYTHFNWYGPNADFQNPYFVMANFLNRDVQNKFFGMGAINIQILPQLSFRFREGFNWVDYQVKNWHPYKDPVFSTHYPEVDMRKTTSTESNTDVLLSWTDKAGDFDYGASIGGNLMHTRWEQLHGDGKVIAIPNALFIAAGSPIYADNSLSQKEIQSVYAFANIGWKNFLYLDLTARNDWSSTLPKDNRSYFYPSVSFSGLVTGAMDAFDIPYNHDVLDFGKIRLSWAKVGKDTAPYQLMNTYGSTKDANGLVYITQPTTMANSALKPEMATSWEAGTEWHFFKNRLGFDLTYYNTTTKNQVMSIALPYSSGVQNRYINAGVINNSGIELMLNGDIVRSRDWDVGLTLNLARNRSKVKELYHSGTIHVDRYELGHMTGSAGVYVYAIEGHEVGEIYGRAYKRNDKGDILVGEDGLPIAEGNSKIGTVNPRFTGSFSINASWRNLAFNALFGFRNGGQIFSVTEYAMAKAGTAKRTADRSNFVFNGVSASGGANSTSISAEKFWTNAIDEEFVYSTSFLKLSELSLGYTFNRDWLARNTAGIVDSAKLSFFGSNLFYFIRHTPGTTPDGSYTDTSIYASAFDMCPYPGSRTFGFSLNIGF